MARKCLHAGGIDDAVEHRLDVQNLEESLVLPCRFLDAEKAEPGCLASDGPAMIKREQGGSISQACTHWYGLKRSWPG